MAAFTSETEQFLQRVEGDKERWTSQYNPGDTVPVSGSSCFRNLPLYRMWQRSDQ